MLTALHTLPKHGILCIEEIEQGLHPLIFGPLLDIFREHCNEETGKQVIMTTHSPDLLDAAEPEEVTTVDRDENGSTQLRTLKDDEQLKEWLDEFRLGELWRQRKIGGVP